VVEEEALGELVPCQQSPTHPSRLRLSALLRRPTQRTSFEVPVLASPCAHQEADQLAQAKARSLEDDDDPTWRPPHAESMCAQRRKALCIAPRPRTGGSSSSGIRRCAGEVLSTSNVRVSP